MKKFMSLMLGMTLVLGTVAFAADDTTKPADAKDKKASKKKAGKKKKDAAAKPDAATK